MSEDEFDLERFRQELEYVRVWKGWDQDGMAKALGIKQNTYSAFKVRIINSMKQGPLLRGLRLIEAWKAEIAGRAWREHWAGRREYDPGEPVSILTDSVQTVANILGSTSMDDVARVTTARRNLEHVLEVLFPRVEAAVREAQNLRGSVKKRGAGG